MDHYLTPRLSVVCPWAQDNTFGDLSVQSRSQIRATLKNCVHRFSSSLTGSYAGLILAPPYSNGDFSLFRKVAGKVGKTSTRGCLIWRVVRLVSEVSGSGILANASLR